MSSKNEIGNEGAMHNEEMMMMVEGMEADSDQMMARVMEMERLVNAKFFNGMLLIAVLYDLFVA